MIEASLRKAYATPTGFNRKGKSYFYKNDAPMGLLI